MRFLAGASLSVVVVAVTASLMFAEDGEQQAVEHLASVVKIAMEGAQPKPSLRPVPVAATADERRPSPSAAAQRSARAPGAPQPLPTPPPARGERVAQATHAEAPAPRPVTGSPAPGWGTSVKPSDGDARASLARTIQIELKRVGCYDGAVDGSWSPATKRSMKAFTDSVNAVLPVESPDYILLTLLQGQRAAACGVGCPAGEVAAAGGQCQPRAVVAQRVAPPAAASTTAPLEPKTSLRSDPASETEKQRLEAERARIEAQRQARLAERVAARERSEKARTEAAEARRRHLMAVEEERARLAAQRQSRDPAQPRVATSAPVPPPPTSFPPSSVAAARPTGPIAADRAPSSARTSSAPLPVVSPDAVARPEPEGPVAVLSPQARRPFGDESGERQGLGGPLPPPPLAAEPRFVQKFVPPPQAATNTAPQRVTVYRSQPARTRFREAVFRRLTRDAP